MMTRLQARKILRAHWGSISALARELNVSRQSVRDVVDGKRNSVRILPAVLARAAELEKRRTDPVEEAACA